MKRILSAALVLAFFGSIAFAQQAPAPEQQAPAPIVRPRMGPQGVRPHDAHRMAAMLSKKLNLTPDQTAKLEPILADQQQKVSALMANTDLDPKTRKKQFHAIHRESQQQIAGILTPDQLEQMKSMRHGQRGRHEAPPAPPAA